MAFITFLLVTHQHQGELRSITMRHNKSHKLFLDKMMAMFLCPFPCHTRLKQHLTWVQHLLVILMTGKRQLLQYLLNNLHNNRLFKFFIFMISTNSSFKLNLMINTIRLLIKFDLYIYIYIYISRQGVFYDEG